MCPSCSEPLDDLSLYLQLQPFLYFYYEPTFVGKHNLYLQIVSVKEERRGNVQVLDSSIF